MQEQRRKSNFYSVKSDFCRKDWQACKVFFNKTCAYCGEKVAKLQQEHVIPITKQGENTRGNIIPVCIRCNSSKGVKDFAEWYKSQPFYLHDRVKRILRYLSIVD